MENENIKNEKQEKDIVTFENTTEEKVVEDITEEKTVENITPQKTENTVNTQEIKVEPTKEKKGFLEGELTKKTFVIGLIIATLCGSLLTSALTNSKHRDMRGPGFQSECEEMRMPQMNRHNRPERIEIYEDDNDFTIDINDKYSKKGETKQQEDN